MRRCSAILTLRWRSLTVRARAGLTVLSLGRRSLVTTVGTTSGRRRRGVLVLGDRVLRHVPLGLTSGLVHVEEALALLVELLDPARGKLTTLLRWGRTRWWRSSLAIGRRAWSTVGTRTGLAIWLLVLGRLVLGRVLLRWV